MAYFNKISMLFIAVVLICHVPSFCARKVLNVENMNGPVLKDNIIASADTKFFAGSPAPPTKIGHAMEVNEMRITEDSAFPYEANPSPGAGN
ncbi:hypothetical protein PTKIN_Ptkin15bG0162200 [Pterospermum kingtungense]